MAEKLALDIVLCLGGFLLIDDRLDGLQEVLLRHSSGWDGALRFWPRSPHEISLDLHVTGTLLESVKRKLAEDQPWSSRVCGSVELRGATSALGLVLGVDEKTFNRVGDRWLWGNRIAIEVRKKKIGDDDAVEWAEAITRDLCATLSPWYARANSTGEYRSKNIDDTTGAVRAVGVDVAGGLPGLYWINFFGAPYVDLLGRDRLLTAPGDCIQEVGGGVLLRLSPNPLSWTSDAYRAVERSVLQHLGERYFFSKSEPTRPSIATPFEFG